MQLFTGCDWMYMLEPDFLMTEYRGDSRMSVLCCVRTRQRQITRLFHVNMSFCRWQPTVTEVFVSRWIYMCGVLMHRLAYTCILFTLMHLILGAFYVE